MTDKKELPAVDRIERVARDTALLHVLTHFPTRNMRAAIREAAVLAAYLAHGTLPDEAPQPDAPDWALTDSEIAQGWVRLDHEGAVLAVGRKYECKRADGGLFTARGDQLPASRLRWDGDETDIVAYRVTD